MRKQLNTIPSSVYRLQVNEAFPLKKVIALLPYLYDLGIEGLYLSPIFECISPHGYDVTNPNKLNPLLGTMEEYEELCAELLKLKMMQVLDIVPNHMGIKEGKNQWWQDVLQYGPDSSFAEFFDIDWKSEKKGLTNKVLLPILEDSYGHVLETGLLKLIWDDGFWVCYHENRFPIKPHTYSLILEKAPSESQEKEWQECLSICEELKRIESEEQDKTAKKESNKKKLIALCQNFPFIKKRFDECIALFNLETAIQDDKAMQDFEPESHALGVEHSQKVKATPNACDSGSKDCIDLSSSIAVSRFNSDLLHELLEEQFYRLAHWVVACQEINYRRFFNINELVAIHTEKEKVFNTYHNWIFDLLKKQKVQGLRIDHPDGLYNPAEYFEQIRAKKPAFVVVEKILNFKETLPENWAVEGTVGYDYLNILNGIFVQKQNENKFSKIYEKFIEQEIDFKALLYERKKAFIVLQMGGEINSLSARLEALSAKNRYYRDFTRPDLTRAIQEVMASFPVYRTYATGEEISRNDKAYLLQAIEMAKTKAPEIDPSVFQYLKNILLLEFQHMDEEDKALAKDFLLRFQQLTAPVMAKGLEDSVYYIYNRLISLNEVGGNPKNFGFSIQDFHQFNKEKHAKWPYSFLAVSTHDTKLSQDVRMRIDVLSEMPGRWHEIVQKWKKHNTKYKKDLRGEPFPDSNTEYYIYQMLIGMWPHSPSEQSSTLFIERLWSSLLKAIREASAYTSWRRHNEEYEKSVKDFLLSIITPSSDNFFYPSFLEFQREIALYGRWNSLSSRVLKIGSPGIVDVYQGNEQWNYSLMDPDNRRPVNYDLHYNILRSFPKEFTDVSKKEFVKHLLADLADERFKLYVFTEALNFRKKNKELFLEGEYEPLHIHEKKHDHTIAFLRKLENHHVVVAGARFFSQLVDENNPLPLGEKCFGETEIHLPKECPIREFTDIFTGHTVKVQMKNKVPVLKLSDVFQYLPFAILG